MASTHLSRTPSSNGSQRIMTFSTWLKRGKLGVSNAFFSTGSNGTNVFAIYFTSEFASGKADSLQIEYFNGSTNYYLRTNRKFRDTSAWYHIVGVLDTTDATESNRMRLYVNNVEETSFDASVYPTQNFDVQYLNSTSYQNNVGNYVGGSYFDGILSHVHFIDGTVYTPSAFGETDSTTGIWKPKTAPSVTYGTNGFFLKFENSGSMGTDSSGNSNTFTVNGTMTQTIDTPSNVFATLNPLSKGSAVDFSNGNLATFGNTSGDNGNYKTNIYPSSGKWYVEVKCGTVSTSNNPRYGLIHEDVAGLPSNGATYSIGTYAQSVSYQNDGGVYSNSSLLMTLSTYTTNDIISLAVDFDNGAFYVGKNGTWLNSADPTSGASKTGAIYTFTANTIFVLAGSSYNSSTSQWNFGNGYFGTTAVSSAQNPDDGIGIFEYSVPTGYRALCTKSINAEEYS